jgi:hypothetical protein
MPGPLACIGPITCFPRSAMGPPHLFFLQSASSRPSAAPALHPLHPLHLLHPLHPLELRARAPKYLAEPSPRAACSLVPSPAVGWASVPLACSLPHRTVCVAILSRLGLANLIKADCAVPGSRSSRRERDLFENTSLSPSYCLSSLSHPWLAPASSRRTTPSLRAHL